MEATATLFSPHLPWPVLAVLALASAALVGTALYHRARGALLRGLVLGAALAALANPTITTEERDPRKDVAVVIADTSASQQLGDRARQTEEAVAAVRDRLARFDDLEVRYVTTDGALRGDGTSLFLALERTLADVSPGLFAGAILITDGQVHDVPEAGHPGMTAPVHALLTGEKREFDRRLTLEQVPGYGIVGETLFIKLRVDDGAAGTTPLDAGRARVTISGMEGGGNAFPVRIGQSQVIPFRLDRGGPAVVRIEVAPGPGELTLRNNQAFVTINGIRNRVRVLLVSGEAHAGERTWRSLLKADPGVDLVHFTILRPPEKTDFTPTNELALIAFPTRELFEEKLGEFDLIIFDRYRRRGVLPAAYLDNVARYVIAGGAILIAAGPTFATPLSLARTPLGRILPGLPNGSLYEQGFRPALTTIGRRHPVTADLPGAETTPPAWGRWFRMVGVEQRRGDVLMNGVPGKPMLILDRVGKGRVAQLLSDHAWLWTRGFEGGGPQAEMLRRIAHWLMKEPELEENVLRAEAFREAGGRTKLRIVRRTIEKSDRPVTVTGPSGARLEVRLREDTGGRSTAVADAREAGLYTLSDGLLRGVVAVPGANPREFADVRATASLLEPLTKALGGSVHWLADQGFWGEGIPDIRRRPAGHAMAGRGWIGLQQNDRYVVTRVTQTPLLPAWLLLLVVLGGLATAWSRESN